MSFNEARYHLRRMWNRFGLRDVIAENGIFFFKFQDEEGIKEVINNGPWMVNNKPMFVQKWCIGMCLDKAEPKKLPVWVKMLKIPMEAWSVKGISALASSLGKPLIIDEVTTRMCLTGVGRIGFINVNDFKIVRNKKTRNEGFVQNRNHHGQYGYTGRQWNVGRNSRENNRKPNAGRFEYRKTMEEVANVKEMGVNNKFTLLNELVDEDELVPNLNERERVDNFVNNRIHPTEKDMEKLSCFMRRYYKDKKEIIDVMDDMDSENVVEEVNGAERRCLKNEVDGLSTSDKQKGVQKLISEEKIQLMAVLETHIKYQNVKKNGVTKKKRAFRFSNIVAKEMSWEKGDVSDRVSKCKGDLKDIQCAMEKDLDNAELRNKSCELLNEYNVAKKKRIKENIGAESWQFAMKVEKGMRMKRL
ncbi:zinc knuckle CX2CX4HX4C containing protein [Tanacetum coccineum]